MSILPDQGSTYASDIDWIIMTITYFVIAWFVVAVAALFYGIFANLKKEGGKAKYIPGIGWAQTKWIWIPVMLVTLNDFYIDIIVAKVWTKVNIAIPVEDKNSVHVKIVGRQFEWNAVYPGPDGKLGTSDDIESYGKPIVMPVNRNVIMNLSSADVLHGFFVREFRYKNDVIPGRIIKRWVQPTKEGTFDLVCVELCGGSHGAMRGEITVLSDVEYAKFSANPESYLDTLPDIENKPFRNQGGEE